VRVRRGRGRRREGEVILECNGRTRARSGGEVVSFSL